VGARPVHMAKDKKKSPKTPRPGNQACVSG